MRLTLTIIAVFLALLMMSVPLTSVLGQGAYVPPHQRPGPAVDILRFRSFNVDTAPAEIRAGQMDLYYFQLKVAAARELRGVEGITIYEAPSSSISLLLNPAPAPEGQLNPFSIKEVRQAMHYIINRDFIVDELYGGMAVSMITHISPFDHDYLTLYNQIRGSKITFDPGFARSIIDPAMTEAGAVMEDGRWTFDGRPIRLRFIVRVEDERREVGDLIRAELENLGFTVDPIFQQFAPAIFTVYSNDPQLFGWHMYTEGWGRSVPERFDSGSLNQFCAPWLGGMPGYQELGFWQYENAELDDLGQRIFTGDFASQEERDSLYAEATEICLDESVRLWIANIVTSLPANSALTGISEDIISGPKSLWTQRDAYIPGRTDLTIGNLWVWTATTTWNPVGGFGDVYSVDIWRNMFDPPITRHPFTGLPIPYRVAYDVETAGPTGSLDVPSDAFVWDAGSGSWDRVTQGTRATSKVVFDYSKYFSSKWHHEESITMADLIYSIYQTFDITYNDEKAGIEFAISTVSKPILDTFKGFRILSDTELEVYIDFWHFAPEYIAEFATPSGLTMPWEVLYAMDKLVFEDRKAAYSQTAAARFSVPWLSLVTDRDARLVRQVLREIRSEETFPLNVLTVDGEQLVTVGEATSRYEATLAWFDEYGLLVISNGPFQLVIYDPPAQFAELRAFRDPTYPFKPGEFFFGSADLLDIVRVDGEKIQIGEQSDFRVTLRGDGDLGVRYILIDPSGGEIIASGDAIRESDLEFLISLPPSITSELRVGFYRLFVAAFSDQISSIREREEIVEATNEVVPPLGEPVDPVEPPPIEPPIEPPANGPVDQPEPSPEAPGLPLGVILPVAVLGIILVVGVVLVLRRK